MTMETDAFSKYFHFKQLSLVIIHKYALKNYEAQIYLDVYYFGKGFKTDEYINWLVKSLIIHNIYL